MFLLREPNPTADSDNWAVWYEGVDAILTLLSRVCEVYPTDFARSLDSGAFAVADDATVVSKRAARTAQLEVGQWIPPHEQRASKVAELTHRVTALTTLLDTLTADVTAGEVDAAAAVGGALHGDVMSERMDATGSLAQGIIGSLTNCFAFAEVSTVSGGAAADEGGVLAGDLVVYWGGVTARGDEYAAPTADGRGLLGAVARATEEAAGDVLTVVVLRSLSPGPVVLQLVLPRGGDRKAAGGLAGLMLVPLRGPLRKAVGGGQFAPVRAPGGGYGDVFVDEAVPSPG